MTSSKVTFTSGVTVEASSSKQREKGKLGNTMKIPLQLLTLLAAGGGLQILIGRDKSAFQLREKDGGRVPLDMMVGDTREGQRHEIVRTTVSILRSLDRGALIPNIIQSEFHVASEVTTVLLPRSPLGFYSFLRACYSSYPTRAIASRYGPLRRLVTYMPSSCETDTF